MIRKLLLGTTAAGLLAAALPASAADLSVAPPPVMAPPPAVFNWSGGYVGGSVGGIWGKQHFEPFATQTSGSVSGCAGAALLGGCGFAFDTDRDSSIIAGFQAGDRWQFGQWVLGVEQDAQWTNVRNSFVLGVPMPNPEVPGVTAGGPFLAGDAFEAKLKFLSNTRAQVGVAFDRFLVYAAGGLATGVMDVTALYTARPLGGAGSVNSPAFTVTDKDKFHVGWTAGGGVEYAITNNVSIGVEYRYTDLSSETYNLGAVTFANGRTFNNTADVDFKAHEVLGRLNIKTAPLLAMFGIH